MKKKLVSIIIRTKNEERWITQCLKEIFKQEYKNFEIILVDNESEDKTVEKAKNFKLKKVLRIKNFLPGKALNLGIKKSSGTYIVCLSAHCIPKNKKWLGTLGASLDSDNKIAGVYGRQEPLSFSSAADKRDLMVIFGLDKKIQIKDSFFHNANSIIRKDLWKRHPFDNKTTNIEDRLWAKQILTAGFKIVYEPNASVFHYHGIHQDGNQDRLNNVINIIEKSEKNFHVNPIKSQKMDVIAIIPTIGKIKYLNGKPLLYYTIKFLKKSKLIKRIIVSTDNKETSKAAIKLGAESPFIRKKKYSSEKINLEKVLKYTLATLEKKKIYSDLVFCALETFPFRPSHNMCDEMIYQLIKNGYDSVLSVKEQSSWIWQTNEKNVFTRVDKGDIRRKFKNKTFVGLNGIGYVTHPEFIRSEKPLGEKIGFYTVDNPFCDFEVRDQEKLKIGKFILNK